MPSDYKSSYQVTGDQPPLTYTSSASLHLPRSYRWILTLSPLGANSTVFTIDVKAPCPPPSEIRGTIFHVTEQPVSKASKEDAAMTRNCFSSPHADVPWGREKQLQEQHSTSQAISTAAQRQRQTKMQEVIIPSENRAAKLSKQLVIWVHHWAWGFH